MATNRVPVDYEVPPFPSLYNPLPPGRYEAYYLYYTEDIWRFTLYWSFIFYAATHATVAACAMAMQCRNWRIFWALPIIYLVIGGLEAFLAGSIVGGVVGATYEAGNFRMSTWTPMIWAGINVMILALSSFPIQGGL